MKNWKIQLTTGAIFLGLGISSAVAQSNYDHRYDERRALVTVYEDCDYRGASRSIDVGEYRKMRDLKFGNDKMSSIKVPRGLEVTIYEHDKFRGDYARIDRDLSCFDYSWNDKVSSLRVASNDRYDDRPGDSRYDGDQPGDLSYDNPPRDDRRSSYANRGGKNVNGENVAQVVFGTSVLQQINKKQWRMNDPRGGVSQFKETRRDNSSVYLQNDYTAERVRIDLFANDVTFTSRDGRSQRYTITRKQAALTSTPKSNDRSQASQDSQNRTIRSACFNFKAYTRGGNGGLRFHGKEGFHRFNKKAKSARVCHNGTLTMEINKTDPNTEVVIEIDGNRYFFARNEKHDAYRNTWYRKLVTLKVGR